MQLPTTTLPPPVTMHATGIHALPPKILTRIFDDPKQAHHLPRPFGVFYQAIRPTYEDLMAMQLEEAKAKKAPDLDKLLRGNEVWSIA